MTAELAAFGNMNMRYLWLSLMFCIIWNSPALYAQDKTLFILGDSLSAGYGLKEGRGWVSLLQQRITQQKLHWRVVNSSISGDTTGNGLQRLPEALKSSRPNIVIIELGGNDGLRGMPPPVIAENLRQLVHLAQQAGARTLLMEMRLPPNYGPAYLKSFVATYTTVANETSAGLVPFFLSDVGGHKDLMQADGIHPNELGQPLLLERVWPLLVNAGLK